MVFRLMRRSMTAALVALLLAATLAFGNARPADAGTTCAIGTPAGAYAQQVDLAPGHARVWRLYQGFFLRQPDPSGMGYWMRMWSGGLGLSDIAYNFANSDEFRVRYGSLRNDQFVDLVYRNVLCRTPDPEGHAYWHGLLNSGSLSRWDMMLNFSEGLEYLQRTRTCHSQYRNVSAAAPHCRLGSLRPLSQARMANDGYQEVYVNVPRWGGGAGSFRGVAVDLARGVFETGNNRCSVASINGNWTVASQKDSFDPAALGIGVVDGRHVKGSSDRTDRGVIGLRFDTAPKDVVEVWPGETKNANSTRLSSVLHHSGQATYESWHAAAESSPYLRNDEPDQIVRPDEWVWAAAGMPLRIDGQTYKNFTADYFNDPYTHQTFRHPFVAVDQDSRQLIFGATQDLTTRDLVVWAENNGYEDLVKFDGGGSAEFNINGRAAVAGTSRDMPVWLGIGC